MSFVLVNWRTDEWLPRALKSIYAQSYRQTEIILVDNASPTFIEAAVVDLPALQLIRNTRNRGFAAANNQGISAARGDIIVLLNCDAYLDLEFTARAVAMLAAEPRIGSVVPKILRDDGSGRIDAAGHLMYHDRTAANRGAGERDQGQYDQAGFVFGGTAAAIVYRREMLDSLAERTIREVGQPERLEYFDESFFAYYEDVDLDWRAQLAGWKAYYEPRCLAWHHAHGSGGIRDWRIGLRSCKNRSLMILKNDTLAGLCARIVPLSIYEGYAFLRLLGRPLNWLWPFSLLACLPLALAKRLRASQRRTCPARDVQRLFCARGLKIPPVPAPPIADEERARLVASLSGATDGPADMPADRPPGFPLVSVILLTLNGLELSRRCIESLLNQSYQPLEIILVDNGSAVDEAELLAMSFPGLRTLRLERNLGFAGGVNWGLTLADGEYIALVNNDCICDADCVRRLVYTARHAGAAAVSGRLLDLRQPELIQQALAAMDLDLSQEFEEAFTGELQPAISAALDESRRNHAWSVFGYPVTDGYGRQPACFYPSGGLCLLQRSALRPLLPELFPQLYFAYAEDVALGLRLRLRGQRVIKEPRAMALHLASSTARRLSKARRRFWQERNRLLNIIGFYPPRVLAALSLPLVLQSLARGLTLLGSPGDFGGWLAAMLWIAFHPLWLAGWRRRCRAGAATADDAWFGELSGNLRGRGGLLNRLSLSYCRALRIPHRETRESGPAES